MPTEVIQLVGGVVSLVALVGGAIWWCMRRHIQHLWRQIRAGDEKRKRAAQALDTAREGERKAKARLIILRERINKLERAFRESLGEREKLRTRAGQLDLQARKQQTEIDHLRTDRLKLDEWVKAAQVKARKLSQAHQQQQAKISTLVAELAEARDNNGNQPAITGLLREKEAEIARLLDERRLLDEQRSEIGRELETLRHISNEQEHKVESLNDQVDDLLRQNRELGGGLEQKTCALEEANKRATDLANEVENWKGEYRKLTAERTEEPGRIWERPAAPGIPEFVPLTQRTMAIIAVINLKGGVGKTTLTANLAATLGLQGKRVLMIDLDYQRSLTHLCRVNRKSLHQEKRTLQHFLMHPAPDAGALLNCSIALEKVHGCTLVANTEALEVKEVTDSLEDTEMQLQAEWLMRPRGQDVRFHLRRALHAPLVRDRFDYVLLDCPPRLSTACINAMAASDFALVPVQLDNVSAVSAPNLLRKLNQLRAKKILPSLSVLGVLANRVKFFAGRLVKVQNQEWENLPVLCREAWGEAVHRFHTMVPQSSQFAAAAAVDGRFVAAYSPELKPVFTDLMKEIDERISHESRRAATVSPVLV